MRQAAWRMPFCSRRPARSKSQSWCHLPTSCSPIGRPSSVQPQFKLRAGWPVMVNRPSAGHGEQCGRPGRANITGRTAIDLDISGTGMRRPQWRACQRRSYQDVEAVEPRLDPLEQACPSMHGGLQAPCGWRFGVCDAGRDHGIEPRQVRRPARLDRFYCFGCPNQCVLARIHGVEPACASRPASAEDGNASSRLEKRSSGGITAASPTTLLSIQVGANAQNTTDPSSGRLY